MSSASERAVKAFQRLLDWARDHDPASAILASLRKPATDQQIARFEAGKKLKLPPALADIYRICDGQDEEIANKGRDDSVEVGLFPSIESGDLAFLLVPLAQLATNTPTTKQASRMPGYRLNWIGFGDNFGGDNIVLDLAQTTPPAKRGRILQFNHEYGGSFELAASFEEYLEHLATGLKSGKIKFEQGSGLSYAKGKDWDQLIDDGKVEYAEDFPG